MLPASLRLAIILFAVPLVTSACGCQGSSSGGGGSGGGGGGGGGSGGGGGGARGGAGAGFAAPATTPEAQCSSLPDYLEAAQRCGDR